jgi:hypothetical protein
MKSAGIVVKVNLRIADEFCRNPAAVRKLCIGNGVRVFLVPFVPDFLTPNTIQVRENCPPDILGPALSHEPILGG